MLRAVTLVLCLACPVPAVALACMPWVMENAFTQARDSEDAYIVVIGTLDFDQDSFPIVDWERQQDVPPETRLPARLTGRMLAQNHQSTPIDTDLEFVVTCAGPWCPQATAGDPVLAFVKMVQDFHRKRLRQSYLYEMHWHRLSFFPACLFRDQQKQKQSRHFQRCDHFVTG